jgi:hypothetical protein
LTPPQSPPRKALHDYWTPPQSHPRKDIAVGHAFPAPPENPSRTVGVDDLKPLSGSSRKAIGARDDYLIHAKAASAQIVGMSGGQNSLFEVVVRDTLAFEDEEVDFPGSAHAAAENSAVSTAPSDDQEWESLFNESEVCEDANSGCSDCGEESDFEYVEIAGTLEVSPAIGTEVKVLHQDDQWWPAQITDVRGCKAEIMYDETGRKDEVDLSVYAVRLRDYVSDDEADVENGSSCSASGSVKREAACSSHEHGSEDESGSKRSKTEGDSVDIHGILTEIPPVGTWVKALHNDDASPPAQVIQEKVKEATLLY